MYVGRLRWCIHIFWRVNKSIVQNSDAKKVRRRFKKRCFDTVRVNKRFGVGVPEYAEQRVKRVKIRRMSLGRRKIVFIIVFWFLGYLIL